MHIFTCIFMLDLPSNNSKRSPAEDFTWRGQESLPWIFCFYISHISRIYFLNKVNKEVNSLSQCSFPSTYAFHQQNIYRTTLWYALLYIIITHMWFPVTMSSNGVELIHARSLGKYNENAVKQTQNVIFSVLKDVRVTVPKIIEISVVCSKTWITTLCFLYFRSYDFFHTSLEWFDWTEPCLTSP